MSYFTLTIEASVDATGGSAPLLDILVDGVPVTSSGSITDQTGVSVTTFTFQLSYTGTYPTSLAFRFNSGSGDGGETVTIENVRINGQALNTGSDLTGILLTQGSSQSLSSPASIDHLFGRTEPTSGDLGTVTKNGTGSDDTLNGTSGADVIDGGVGNDRLRGLDDDDAINGGDGDDLIFGETGNDIIIGGLGNDRITGNDGDDLLYGQGDDDILMGEAGNDILNGGTGNDTLIGHAGDDILYGEDGDDRLIGVTGNNIMYGDAGNDILLGGNQNDIMYGGANDDQINGGNGDDEIYGETGNDSISGGAGIDTIDAGDNDDLVYGGAGNDDISGGNGIDLLYGDEGDDTINGGGGEDTIVGGTGADTLNGGNNADIIHGHGLTAQEISIILRNNAGVVYSQETGSFYMYVSSTANYATAVTNAASQTINGVAGHLATITGAAENTYISSLLSGDAWISGFDTGSDGTWIWNTGVEHSIQFSDISGNAVNGFYENWDAGQPQNNTEYWAILNADGTWHDWPDTSSHGYVIEWEGGQFNDDDTADIINGGSGNDWLYGWGGDDTIDGSNGDDFLFGQDGDDTMDGGANADILVGGNGSDTLLGDSDNDILYAAVAGTVGAQTVTGSSGGPLTATLLSEDFAGGIGTTFTYADYNDPSNAHVSGSYNTNGSSPSGSAQINIQRNGSTFSNGAGLYAATVSYAADVTNAQITFSYRHTHTTQNDTGEDSSVIFVFDGTIYDQFGGNGYINTALGSAGATDTGWVTVTIDLPDMTANTNYSVWLAFLHTGSNGNNEDAMVRFDDVTITGEVDTLYLINENFTSSSGVFAYGDNLFGGTDSNNYASGTRITTDGDNANGALETTLGYNGGGAQTNYSGGWSTTVDLTSDTDNITLDFSYRLLRGAGFENNEDAYVYVEIDNVKYGVAPNNYIITHEGNGNGGPSYDSGWQTVVLDIGTLTAGSHTVEIGVFHEGSTVNGDEDTVLRLDDIVMSATAGADGNDATSSGNDSTSSNYLDGGDGDDVLYGSAGDDYLYGGAGSDALYSDSAQIYTVSDALAEISGLQYNADTGSFYLYVNTAVNAATAFSNAAAQSLNGVAGHLVQITTATENTYVDTLSGTSTIWIGMTDTAVEGEWRFIGGPNDGELFWLGDSTGSLQSGYTYENFNGGEPNDYVGGEDYMEMQNGGGWNDNGGPNNPGLTHQYVVEWEASEIFSFGATVLNGGDGADDLYGSAGSDLFAFDNNSDAFTNPDTIHNFDQNDGDAIDISDILSGLGVNSSNLSQFVDISESNGVRIDTAGTGSFSSGDTVATFTGLSSVSDEATMLANGNLIIY